MEDISFPQMPIPFRVVQHKAASVVASWFPLHEKIEPVFGLLMGTYYNPDMYVETEFLTLMQALEIFHRRLIGGGYLAPEQWNSHREALIRTIPQVLSDGHKAALANRLKYGYEYSLRKRLDELLNSLSETTRNRITEGYQNFVADCAETRNVLVHAGGGGILSRGLEALWRTNQRLRNLLNILIWKRLGLSEETITDWR